MSGYYKYLNNKDYKKEHDKNIVQLISKICKSKKYKLGIRSICMILKNKYHIYICLKKIARIKKEYGIATTIRKKNIYNLAFKKGLEHRTADNLLMQNFKIEQPDKVYSTDISYLFYAGGKRAYLSATKDLASKEIVSFNVNPTMCLEISNQGLSAKSLNS